MSKTKKNHSKIQSKPRKMSNKVNKKKSMKPKYSLKKSKKRVVKMVKKGGFLSTPSPHNAHERGSFIPVKAHKWFSGEYNYVTPPDSDPTLRAMLPEFGLDRRYENSVTHATASTDDSLRVQDVTIDGETFKYSLKDNLKPSEVKAQ